MMGMRETLAKRRLLGYQRFLATKDKAYWMGIKPTVCPFQGLKTHHWATKLGVALAAQQYLQQAVTYTLLKLSQPSTTTDIAVDVDNTLPVLSFYALSNKYQ